MDCSNPCGVSSHHVLTQAFGDAYCRHENVRHATLSICVEGGSARIRRKIEECRMNDMSEEKLLRAIQNAISIETNIDEVEGCFTEKYPPLSDEPTDEERYVVADSGTVIFEDEDYVPRMPIKINGSVESVTVYQDIRDGGIYDNADGGNMYSDQVQKDLVEMGKAFGGNGVDNRDESDVLKFILGEAASENTFTRRSQIPAD